MGSWTWVFRALIRSYLRLNSVHGSFLYLLSTSTLNLISLYVLHYFWISRGPEDLPQWCVMFTMSLTKEIWCVDIELWNFHNFRITRLCLKLISFRRETFTDFFFAIIYSSSALSLMLHKHRYKSKEFGQRWNTWISPRWEKTGTKIYLWICCL